jgi:hypothetical protein
VSDFQRYMTAQADRRAASAEYNAAAARLELADIKMRLAELRSQHEPAHAIMASGMDPRLQIIEGAAFVVTGRRIPCTSA